ncbi:LOG family protein [Oecophyllibacter saccharovorans]|uniref:Cytokinin riboside 5'-monophosphate phosphoribohydrolase n=1 Tax=Oecophyllibacter saccharovorans TaxID=2558360 RepID=A0A506USA4_9PROT|nr:TIGR00730 family Rossman fold protein [Oecophyllibacter saccharovorans]TPW36227.1 TIGR00730 family Rossman fold protein [Oecophyllibacter saccharovorans]
MTAGRQAPETVSSCAVFCGSRPGRLPAYTEAARAVGTALAEAGITLIYGGGNCGLMGQVADAVLAAGGTVKGIIPQFLHSREGMHAGVTDLEVTADMPSRKERLFTLPQAYVILPGGIGTLDEFAEVLVNHQLDQGRKPICVVNAAGWADPLLACLEAMVEQGFAEPALMEYFGVVADAEAMIRYLKRPLPSAV